MPLKADIGHASLTGPRARNEDFVGVVTPQGAELENKGLLAALADGVGGHADGREAAEFTVRSLLNDYYATPDTWSVSHSLDKVISAANRWLFAQSLKRSQTAGMATTLSSLVLRGRRWYCAHVGDSRVYLLRDRTLECLTQDHVWEHPELRTVLSRAVGLDSHISTDSLEGELLEGDAFLLVSDGIWATLSAQQMLSALVCSTDAQEAAFSLAKGAVDGGSRDNCSAIVLRVMELPPDTLRDAIARIRVLPLPSRLKPGQEIDGLVVLDALHESRITLLYRVRKPDGQICVLKTLRDTASPEDAAALAHEEWLARRVTDAAFPQVLQWPERRHLYYLMTWHEGETLKQRLDRGHRFAPQEIAGLGEKLLRAVAVLHRLSIIHRDIKPDNIHLGSDGRLRLLDLGVAASDGQDEGERFGEINNPGTPSYMAPELFPSHGEAHRANESTDLYASGVTLYELCTRQYPYGEVEPFQRPRFGDPIPPTRYRPDVPDWLESVLLKAVGRSPQHRFETAEEFILALQCGANRPLAVPRRRPLADRDPHFLLKLLCAASLIANIALAVLLMRS